MQLFNAHYRVQIGKMSSDILKGQIYDLDGSNKRPIGLIAPPFKINFLATENLPKMKLKSVRILQKIIHLASGCHIW